MCPLDIIIARQGFAVLDGALATELERHGADLDDPLWSARCLIEAPGLIARVHREYLQAGADVILSATYQASEAGFVRHGLTESEARELMREGVRLAVRERDAFWSEYQSPKTQDANKTAVRSRLRPLVAASQGPYGACLHDGSEYHGRYAASWDEVEAFHRRRIEILAEAGADLLAFETIPSLPEAERIAGILNEAPGMPAWISFSCRDGNHICHGEALSDCVAALAGIARIVAIGINCTAPCHIVYLLQTVEGFQRPMLVYPNSGEHWIASENRWVGKRAEDFDVAGWYAAGARGVGGCCRTGPADIERIRRMLARLSGIRSD